jgi:adenine phosphoribosyltransferase
MDLAHYGRGAIDKVVGIEARGFILAAPVAYHFGAGFVPVRKRGKLPSETYEQTYDLEYGTETIEIHRDAFRPGERVLIVDDVLATGGTAQATAELVRRAGADVAGLSVLMELSFLNGRDRLAGLDLHSVVTV